MGDSWALQLVQMALMQKTTPETSNGAAAGSRAPQPVMPVVPPVRKHVVPPVVPPVVQQPVGQQLLVQPDPPPLPVKRKAPAAESEVKRSGKLPVQLEIPVGAGSANPGDDKTKKNCKKDLIAAAFKIYHGKHPDRTFELFRSEYTRYWKLHKGHKSGLIKGTSLKKQKPPHFWPIAEIIASKDSKVKSHNYGELKRDWCIENGFMNSEETVGGGSPSKQKKVIVLGDDSSDDLDSPVEVKKEGKSFGNKKRSKPDSDDDSEDEDSE